MPTQLYNQQIPHFILYPHSSLSHDNRQYLLSLLSLSSTYSTFSPPIAPSLHPPVLPAFHGRHLLHLLTTFISPKFPHYTACPRANRQLGPTSQWLAFSIYRWKYVKPNLNSLPNTPNSISQITQMIAVDIEDDADLLNFRLTCSHFNSAADDDQVTFWRSRFLTRYDPPAKPSKFTFKKRYIQRLNGLKLHLGPQKKAKLSLGPASVAVIRDLIAESFTPSKSNQYTFSKNMALVHDLMHRHGLFDGKTKMPKQKRGDSPKKPDFLLHAVQLTLTHVYLKSHTLSAGGVHMDFPTSQQMAYASAASQPIFDNTGCVNMEWTLHVAHFFRYYFLKPTEQLAGYFADLSPSERPQCWSEALRGGPQVLGKQWLGSYSECRRGL